jgi:hypothetical protein
MAASSNRVDAQALLSQNGDFSKAVVAQIVPGSDQEDGVVLLPQDELIWGGPGDDVFGWPDQNFTSVPVIDGGSGTNTLSLGEEIGRSCTTVGNKTTLSSGSTKVALLF